MKPHAICAPVLLFMFCYVTSLPAEPFSADWRRHWQLMLGEEHLTRHEDGSLELDYGRGQHVYFAGGENLHDFAVTAKVKFLRADDKYSGFSLYLRLRGAVWGKRAGYWVYLRPKFRGLFMQKVVDGQLDREFATHVEAVRPKSTPLGEWMTLRCEVRGRRIEVYLNDKLHLSATDDGRFPILSGRVMFGVGNARVILADLTQINLEKSERIAGVTYRYVNAPTRGDKGARILTDGKINPPEEQAFWRMLGPRPEIVFDLGQEYFVTRIALRAVSSPATNISSAEVQGSADRESWDTLAVLQNRDPRRAVAEHEISGDVRRVARFVKLTLARPAADQDVELAEVEFYGREPTAEDRQAGAAAAYVIGPEMPPTTEATQRDEHYWYLNSKAARFAIDRHHGVVAGGWSRTHGEKCLERLPDSYYLYTRGGDTEANEYEDRVESVLEGGANGRLRLRCTNPALPDLIIVKTYSLSDDGTRLVKRVGFTSTSDQRDRFLTHRTGGVLAEQFRRGGVYMGGDRGLGARLFADRVKLPTTNKSLGARNAKVVLFMRYDLGWGLAHYRYKINDRYCRPVTSRWHEKENHPPIYTPNGWEMGLCTLHLAPRREQSTETHLALFDGRQYDFYGMYRSLPEVARQYAAVKRPRWVTNLKTSCDVALNPLTADLTGPLLPVRRTLEMTQTGTLWKLMHIHGIWGEWVTEGLTTNGYGAKLDTQWLKDYIAAGHKLSPRVKIGVYTWAWAAHPRSRVYRDHPEWFITTDRSGQVFSAYSNMVLNHARRLGIKESQDELMDEFEHVMRDFGGDFFYLDGGGGGQNLIDWEHLGCDQDYDYEELYRRIRQVARACGDDKAVWFNARTGPYWDIGYYEGIDQRLTAATWRESADGFACVKIRHAYDPGQVVIPLYWRDSTRPFFSNYCIGLGLTPSSPLGAEKQRLQLPFIEAAYETRGLRWIEADLKPDWRTDPDTQIEAYTLRRADAAVISLVDHRESGPGLARISADTRKLGLDPRRPVYAWVFGVRDIRHSWPALPEATRREVYRRTGWGLDLAGRLLGVQVIERPAQRLELSVPTEPHLLRMVLLSNSPAGVFSVGGLRTNFWLPENLGASARIRASDDGRTLTLSVNAPAGGAEFIVSAPPGKALVSASGRTRPLAAYGHDFLIVPVDAGKHTIELKTSASEEHGGRVTIECPQTIAAGSTLELRLAPAPRAAQVSLWRDGVPVYAGEQKLREGLAQIQVPAEVHGGRLDLHVSASVGGKSVQASRALEIAGDYAPELVPVTLPKLKPKLQIAEVDRTVRGLRVLRTGTDTYDGYDGTLFAQSDADTLEIAGGSLDAPRSRYGYGFGGLELQEARVLTLQVTNTFYDAWTFYRDRVSYHPTYTSTFAGMMVDYHTAHGYAKRVALGLGLINPRRKSPRPTWGTGAAPADFINLTDAIHEGREAELTIDLSKWAPPDWDGRCWLSAGAENVLPSRRIRVKILEASKSPEGKTINEGQSVGDLYKMRTYRIVRAFSRPKIDGKLDDQVWAKAPFADAFRLLGRLGTSTQNTRAWITYDDAALYVAFDCPESEKKQLSTTAKKIWNQDAVDLALDVDADRVDFHQVIVNCKGEMEQFSQGSSGRKETWKLAAAAAEHEGGWAVEMAIPWDQLKLRPRPGLKWSGNFVRYRPKPPDFEMQTWSPLPGPSLIVPERFGEFVFE